MAARTEGESSLLPDSRDRSAAREMACFAARRANGATRMADRYVIREDVLEKPTILGNILRKLQCAIICRRRRCGDVIHNTWPESVAEKDTYQCVVLTPLECLRGSQHARSEHQVLGFGQAQQPDSPLCPSRTRNDPEAYFR